MANRRLVNLAMRDYKNRMFSMHRMDLSKLLFYPSTDEAEAAGGKAGKPPKMGGLKLPPPIMSFQPCPSSSAPLSSYGIGSMFVLLHGPRGRSSEASRILFTNSAGQASMYDVEAHSVISVPHLTPDPMGYTYITPIVTGTDAGEQALYVMCPHSEFKVLDFNNEDKSRRRRAYSLMNESSLKWQSLPPLPLHAASISSFTVVDDDRIICVSTYPDAQDTVTFCFDTVSQEWWQAGDDWALPFHGRAEYVPELQTWLGFSSGHPHHLCTADLSSVAMAPRQGPTLQHVWEDYNPPPTEESKLVLNKDYPGIFITTTVEWSVSKSFLVNLGSGRFCVAKVVNCEKEVELSCSFDNGPEELMGRLTVLTGVEVIRGGGDGKLRMIKHKSRRLVHPGLSVACVL